MDVRKRLGSASYVYEREREGDCLEFKKIKLIQRERERERERERVFESGPELN